MPGDQKSAWVAITSIDEAIAHADAWERCCRDERRDALREIRKLQARVFELEHALAAAKNEIFVLETCLAEGWPLDAMETAACLTLQNC